uniref:ABC transporter permease n=1 Tax=Desertihabitans aurantiacus TaxID=2282477 RepID=UPI0013008564
MLPEIIRNGLTRGLVELRHSITLVFNYVFFPSLALIATSFLRGIELAGSGASVGQYAIPGIVAMNVLFTGLMGLATTLITEREDGTLLRARSVPNGIHSYLLGKVTTQVVLIVATMAVVLVEAALLFRGSLSVEVANLVHLAWILPLALLATLPFGALLGALISNPRHLSFMSLVLMGVVSVSGVFYPLARMPEWVQVVGQSTPLYWMGLGLRSTMLGDQVLASEIGQSWRLPETAAVLTLWSVVGVVLAVRVLRGAARRQGGSRRRGRRAVP